MFAENQANILSRLDDLQATLLRVTTQLDMRRKVNIDKYFPVRDDAHLQQFLNKTDGDFQVRREEFENLLYLNVTKSLKLKRPFETHLLAAIFSRDYISSHRWPGPR